MFCASLVGVTPILGRSSNTATQVARGEREMLVPPRGPPFPALVHPAEHRKILLARCRSAKVEGHVQQC